LESPAILHRRLEVPYQAEISRTNPSCFLFLIDQSGSMGEIMDPANAQALDKPVIVDGQTFTHTATGQTKAQAVSDAINRLLQNLSIKCAKSEGVRDYYSVSVIGYGGDKRRQHRRASIAGVQRNPRRPRHGSDQ
jgi:hypothetical protein